MFNSSWLRSAFVLGISAAAWAADPQLARDVEALRNSLPLQDSARPTLTLRLADVLFDQAVELGGNPLLSEGELQQVKSARTRSLALYQEALGGTKYHAGAQGALAQKIKFQIARLQQELGAVDSANKLWKELAEQKELHDIQREAALRLAEYYEKSRAPGSLKQAENYYRQSIDLCGQGDMCAYGHYRLAWTLREAGELKPAIEEMQVALFDSKGQPREEALRDLIVFLSMEKTDGEEALLLVEKLAARVARPTLFDDLAEAFYSAGNRVAGTRALEYVNGRSPSLANQIRLMEEFYGMRNWDKFRLAMDQASNAAIPAEGVDAKTEKIIRRLSVQLDGERASRAEYAPEFKSVVLLYMKLFPKNKDQFKMMEGWMAAEADPKAKMKKIDEWVNGPDLGLSKEEQIKLRETRLALAGKEKDSEVVGVEASRLAGLVKDPARIREYRFIEAAALKEQGKVDEALAQLNTWTKPDAAQDTWTFRGGLMIADILVDKKQNAEIARVTDLWVESPQVQTAAKAAKEKKVWDEGLKLLTQMREEARFETAVQLGEKPAALTTFEQYCLAGKFLPKSCENARVLAVKLKNQKSILTLLKATGKMDDLQAEYEAAGFFADAAEMQEKKLGSKAEDTEYLKLALLYELGGRVDDRNRLLGDLVKKMKARKSAGDSEEIIYATLKDAKLLGLESLDLPWSEKNRLRLANMLELEGKGTPRTRKELLASTKAVGLAWSKYVLEELAKLDVAQRKITFYGRQGQTKFKQRLTSIGALDAGAEKYFGGADLMSRSRIALLLRKGYTDFSNEILNSPMPEGLSPEVLAEAKASLTAMAEPFQKKAADYEKLAKDQLAEIPVGERAALEALLLPDVESVTIATVDLKSPSEGAPSALTASNESYTRALAVLHEDPSSATALKDIKKYYEDQGKERLASYFQGRLLQLDSGKGEKQ